jgi:hypothetical protein
MTSSLRLPMPLAKLPCAYRLSATCRHCHCTLSIDKSSMHRRHTADILDESMQIYTANGDPWFFAKCDCYINRHELTLVRGLTIWWFADGHMMEFEDTDFIDGHYLDEDSIQFPPSLTPTESERLVFAFDMMQHTFPERYGLRKTRLRDLDM